MARKALQVIIVFVSLSVMAQTGQEDNPMVTDRPDQTEASSTVGKNTLIIETGAAYREYDSRFRESDLTYNTTLVRTGIWSWAELRLGVDYTRFDNSRDSEETFSPLLIGAKFALYEGKSGFPEVGILGHVLLPQTVTESLRPEDAGYEFRALFTSDLGINSSLGYNIGVRNSGNDLDTSEFLYTLAYSYQVLDNTALYAELYGNFSQFVSPMHLWNVGATMLITDDFQGDVSVGTSFNGQQRLYIGAGLSYRVKNLLR